MSDLIRIKALSFDAILGVLPEERTTPQQVILSLDIYTDTRDAAATGALADTIDYAAVSTAARELTVSGCYELVERLAQDLADMVLRDTRATAVRVEVAKPQALAEAASVGVSIYRAR